MRRVLDDAGDNFDAAQGLRRIDGPETKTGQITYRIVTDGGNPNIDAPAVTRQLREEHGIETAGGVQQALGELERLRHVDDLSASEQATLGARLSKSQDSSATRTFVDELDTVDDVRRLLDQDQASVNRLVDWHANPGSYRNIDPDLEASDFVGVVKNNGNPAETRLVTKDPEGNLVWLENGNSGSGWVHIRDDHRDHFRSEFSSVRGGELTIEDLVYEAVKNPHRTEPNPGGGIRYYDVVDDSEIRVATGDNGYVITAHPDT